MKKAALALGITAGIAGAALVGEKERLTVTHYQLSAKISAPLRVVQLADLHGKCFGRENRRLLSTVEGLHPALVVLTGDTISADCHALAETITLLARLTMLCPVVLIPGNHEYRSGRWEEIAPQLRAVGVQILENQALSLTIRDEPVQIVGCAEGLATSRLDYLRELIGQYPFVSQRTLLEPLSKAPGLRLVLSHFPEYFSLAGHASYAQFSFDAMLAGHAHGGHWRWKNRGLFAAGQGFFPRFSGGCYGEKPALIVSRGLGNDSPLPRIGNPPEVVAVTFLPEERAALRRERP